MVNEKIMEERKVLVDRIIENMKNGYVLPKPSWDRAAFMIHNPISNARYRGGNMLRLYLAAMDKGYTDNRWVTFKQAQQMGWKVKSGEKGIKLEKYIFEKVVEKENPDTGEMEKEKVKLTKPIINTFVVFNAAQIDGIPEPEPHKKLEHDEIMQIAEDFISSSECPIVETDEGRAYYSPKQDKIVLPYRDAFLDQTSFLATQLHEMVHSTGHPGRLGRNLLNSFGSAEYAKEELRAELGAFFIQTDLGISLDAQHFNSHTEYLESWIKALEDDPNELFRAMSDAQKAASYLEERYECFIQDKVQESPQVGESEGIYKSLSEQEIAALQVAFKHEMKSSGSGKQYLDAWIEKQNTQRNELQLPSQSEHFDYIRSLYSQMEKVNETMKQCWTDEKNYFKLSVTVDSEYPFKVEKVSNGHILIGKQCKDIEEVNKFAESLKQNNDSVFKTPKKKKKCSR